MGRIIPIIFLFFICIHSAFGQYIIALENGDSLHVKEYYVKGDSLGFPGGKVAKNDVVTLNTKKEVFIFKVRGGAMRKIKLEDRTSPCGLATTYAERYEDSGVDIGEFTLMDSSLVSRPEFITCWRAQLLTNNIRTDSSGHLSKYDRIEQLPFIYTGNMIIQRNGDTLRVEKDFFVTKEALNWMGGDKGGSMPFDEVLLVINAKGPNVIKEKRHMLAPAHLSVNELSPATQGLIYAQIYAGLPNTSNEIANLPDHVKNDPEFTESYYAEQQRIIKNGENWRAVNGTLRIITNMMHFVP